MWNKFIGFNWLLLIHKDIPSSDCFLANMAKLKVFGAAELSDCLIYHWFTVMNGWAFQEVEKSGPMTKKDNNNNQKDEVNTIFWKFA